MIMEFWQRILMQEFSGMVQVIRHASSPAELGAASSDAPRIRWAKVLENDLYIYGVEGV